MKYIYFISYCSSGPKNALFELGNTEITIEQLIVSIEHIRQIENALSNKVGKKCCLINFTLLRIEEDDQHC